jgi:hypothetical protein
MKPLVPSQDRMRASKSDKLRVGPRIVFDTPILDRSYGRLKSGDHFIEGSSADMLVVADGKFVDHEGRLPVCR